MDNLIDFSDDTTAFECNLFEAVRGQNGVLARIHGQFFVPEGISRNKRFYPRELWEDVLGRSSTKQALTDGMLGTFLHPKGPEDSHAKYASHVIKKLWINGKAGLGEAFILDTPIGRIVNTLQESKLVTLYVSSRAWGQYKKGSNSRSNSRSNGLPVVDKDSYTFETFDVVTKPGFLEAKPNMFSEMLEGIEDLYHSELPNLSVLKKVREARAVILSRDVDYLINRSKKFFV